MTKLITAVPVCMLVVSCGGGISAEMSTIEDTQFLAFVDDDGDGLSANNEPRLIRFSDYSAKKRPGTKVIMVNAAAGWCGPCMHEASKLSEFAAIYAPKGVAVLTAVFQKGNATAADVEFTKLWAQTFRLSIPTIVDSTFATGKYFDVNTLPANLFINAATAQVLTVATGAKPGNDPMKEYRDLLDHYLGEP